MSGEEVGGVVRAVVAFLGGFLVSKGLIDSATLVAVAGAAATLVAAAWSVYAKRKVEPQV
jgi:hypothetical protein